VGRRTLQLVYLVAAVSLAAPASAEDQISGFVTYATGEVTGRVTDEAGKPLSATKVHAVSTKGEQIVTTDNDGRYRIVLHGGTTTIFVRGVVKISAQTLVSSDAVPGEELVEIREHIPPAVMPKALTDRNKLPEYSKTARDHNAWAKAWLMLDVSATGTVTRVKLLHAPGYDLDKIAVREAFNLRFQPARDRSKKAVPANMLWSFEWPSYFWMLDGKHTFNRLPREVASVPCRGSGPGRVHRDCTTYDITKEQTAPWLDPPKK
jgi:hypothetical protein